MSASYYIFLVGYNSKTENFVKLDPYFKNSKGEFEQNPFVYNGSRSYFSDTWEKLCELTEWKDISKLQGLTVSDFVETLDGMTENSLFVVPFERVCDITPAVNIFNNIGFKLRSSADDEDDESYLMSPVEFSKLDDKAKRCYDYYEYDSPSSWQYHFKDITERVLFIQEQINWMHDVYYRVKDLYLVCMGGF